MNVDTRMGRIRILAVVMHNHKIIWYARGIARELVVW